MFLHQIASLNFQELRNAQDVARYITEQCELDEIIRLAKSVRHRRPKNWISRKRLPTKQSVQQSRSVRVLVPILKVLAGLFMIPAGVCFAGLIIFPFCGATEMVFPCLAGGLLCLAVTAPLLWLIFKFQPEAHGRFIKWINDLAKDVSAGESVNSWETARLQELQLKFGKHSLKKYAQEREMRNDLIHKVLYAPSMQHNNVKIEKD